jgi:hypothetical protein
LYQLFSTDITHAKRWREHAVRGIA